MTDTSQQQPPTPSTPPPRPDPLETLDTWAKSFGAREKSEGRAAALREIQQQLGMTPDEAAAFIKQAQDQQRESLSEAERKLQEATEKETKAAERTAEAARKALDSEKRAALIEAGATRGQAKLLLGMVEVPADADDEKIAEAVENLKKTFPQLFTPPENEGDEGDENDDTSGGAPPAGAGAPPSGSQPPDSRPRGKPQSQPASSRAAKARERLHNRHPNLARNAGKE